MKNLRLTVAGAAAAAGFLLLGAGAVAAAERLCPEPVRIIWVRRDLVPTSRRRALARLLTAVVSGQPRDLLVRNSRPQIDDRWAETLGSGGVKPVLTPGRSPQVYPVPHRGNKKQLRAPTGVP